MKEAVWLLLVFYKHLAQDGLGPALVFCYELDLLGVFHSGAHLLTRVQSCLD